MSEQKANNERSVLPASSSSQSMALRSHPGGQELEGQADVPPTATLEPRGTHGLCWGDWSKIASYNQAVGNLRVHLGPTLSN